ncbi:MAG TPA: ROK family protein [Ktedonobacterales bacterium]|jgi:glucokinase|nr:ROK family protein [Ktedonobacterales bacterium]
MSDWHGESVVSAVGHVGVELADLGTRITLATPGALPRSIERILRARFDQPPAPIEVIERIVMLMAEVGATPTTTLGVAVWGSVASTRGEITDPRFGDEWRDVPFTERLEDRLGSTVRLGAGVNAAARAEVTRGAGIGQSPLLYVHLGRSVTSALVVDGEPLVGAHDDAGKLGHWQTGLDGPRCACGARGHLDPIVSAQSLVRLAIGAAADDEDALAAIHHLTGRRAEALTAPQLVTLARDGVRPLRELLDVALDALAGALANLTVTLDPQMIVIGGPLALADDVLFVWLRERISTQLSGVMPAPPVVAGALEPHAALLGAIWS